MPAWEIWAFLAAVVFVIFVICDFKESRADSPTAQYMNIALTYRYNAAEKANPAGLGIGRSSAFFKTYEVWVENGAPVVRRRDND